MAYVYLARPFGDSNSALDRLLQGDNVGNVVSDEVKQAAQAKLDEAKQWAIGKAGQLVPDGWGGVTVDMLNGNWTKAAEDAVEKFVPGVGWMVGIFAGAAEHCESGAALMAMGQNIVMGQVEAVIVADVIAPFVAEIVAPLVAQVVTAAVNALPQAVVNVVSIVVNVTQSAVGGTVAAIGGVASTAASVLSVASGPLIVVGAAIAVVGGYVEAKHQEKVKIARDRRSWSSEILKGSIADAMVVPSGAKVDDKTIIRPRDFFIQDPKWTFDGTSEPSRPSVYAEFLAVERGTGTDPRYLMHIKPIPQKERDLLCMLRLSLMTDQLGDAGTTLWPLYMDLIAKQFRLGRVRYATSRELAGASPSWWPEPNGRTRLMNENPNWAFLLSRAYEKSPQSWTDADGKPTSIPPDPGDDVFVFGDESKGALNAFEAMHPGLFDRAWMPAQVQLQTLVDNWLKDNKPVDKSPAAIQAFTSQVLSGARDIGGMTPSAIKALAASNKLKITKAEQSKFANTAVVSPQQKAALAAARAKLEAARKQQAYDADVKEKQGQGTLVLGVSVAALAVAAVAVALHHRKQKEV
jgi:hypothetical protein